MRVRFGFSAYDKSDYNLPVIELENWYAEERPALGQVRLLPTPGLTLFLAASTGVRGLFQADGILSGQIIFADGTTMRRVTSGGVANNIGTVATDDFRAQFAASFVDLVASSGGTAYVVASGSVTPITVGTASGSIVSVAHLRQRHLFAEEDGRLWWSAVGDPTDVPAINFAETEFQADGLLRIEAYKDNVWAFGSDTLQLFVPTSAQDQAFIPRPGGVLPLGLIGRDAVVQSDDALFMVERGGLIFRLEPDNRQLVSTPDITKRIKALSSANQKKVALSSYRWNEHEFIRIVLPGQGCWNYDLSTGAWHRARTLNADTHIATDYVSAYSTSYAAGVGGIYSLSETVYTEAGQNVRRVAEALVPIEDGRPAIESLTIYTSTIGVPLSGEGSQPKVMLSVSRDGVTFEPEAIRDLPIAGEYTKPVTWRTLGRSKPPVIRFRLAFSEKVGMTLSDCQLNMSRP